jgi:F-type H+-transporting ATPase subunit a
MTLLLTNSIPPQVYSSILIIVVLSIIFIIIGCRIKKLKPEDKTPVWLVPFIMIVDLINNMTKENLGKFWKHYAPYYLTLTIYLFVANISGIFGLSNPTSYILVNAALALISFFIIQLTAIISNGGWNYFKGFFEPIFFLFPINLISEITLPISLALRLMGNIMSGAVLSKMLFGVAKMVSGGTWAWIAIPILPFYNAVFDIFFGVIQTVVFLLLSIMFAGMKLNDKDKLENLN